jgi:hypothetical protein
LRVISVGASLITASEFASPTSHENTSLPSFATMRANFACPVSAAPMRLASHLPRAARRAERAIREALANSRYPLSATAVLQAYAQGVRETFIEKINRSDISPEGRAARLKGRK